MASYTQSFELVSEAIIIDPFGEGDDNVRENTDNIETSGPIMKELASITLSGKCDNAPGPRYNPDATLEVVDSTELINIRKCDCDLGGLNIDHAILPNTVYNHCPQCDNDYNLACLKYLVTNKICLCCGEVLEQKNSANIKGYKEAFDKLVEAKFINEYGIARFK